MAQVREVGEKMVGLKLKDEVGVVNYLIDPEY